MAKTRNPAKAPGRSKQARKRVPVPGQQPEAIGSQGKTTVTVARQNALLKKENEALKTENARLLSQVQAMEKQSRLLTARVKKDIGRLEKIPEKILQAIAGQSGIREPEIQKAVGQERDSLDHHLAALFHLGFVHRFLHVRHMFQSQIPDQFSITQEGVDYLKSYGLLPRKR